MEGGGAETVWVWEVEEECETGGGGWRRRGREGVEGGVGEMRWEEHAEEARHLEGSEHAGRSLI